VAALAGMNFMQKQYHKSLSCDIDLSRSPPIASNKSLDLHTVSKINITVAYPLYLLHVPDIDATLAVVSFRGTAKCYRGIKTAESSLEKWGLAIIHDLKFLNGESRFLADS